MELHPLAQHFDAVADDYDYGRPDYVPAVAGAIAGELGLDRGDPVLDLAAGTGKLSRALLAFGFDLTAVEPQPALRGLLAGKIGPERTIDGVAEAIPVADASQALVTVADAFHWFNRPKALAEMRRVLRPGGGLALLNTVPDWRGASWAHELGTMMVQSRPEHPNFDGAPWQEFVRAAPGWGEPWTVRVTTYPLADIARIVSHMGSTSWVAAMEPTERAAFLARIDELLRSGETPERLPLHYEIGLARALSTAG